MLRHLDCRQLSICSGQKCWGLFIDIVVMLPDASNLLELMSQGIFKALQTTRIPEVEGILNKRTQELYMDVKSRSFALDLESLPLISSVYLVGDSLVLDPSAEEEQFASGVLHTSVRHSRILGIAKESEG
jgi:exosome complex RNA-binding protein Rrp42 (RNase PH superfamily)